MIDKEKIIAFINKRIEWNKDLMKRDQRPSDIGRIEEAKCILRFIDSLQEEPMPEWRRATEDNLIGCLVWDEVRHFHLYNDRVYKGELYISIADILRLPGSPRKE